MATKTIPIRADLQKLMELPDCSLLALPQPEPASVRLPSGAKLTAFADISKGIPTDCAHALSISLQLAPFLASIECLVKVLGLLKPLIEIINGLPAPPGPQVILDFGKAAKEVSECIIAFAPGAGLFAFIKDLLLLLIKFLKCFIGALETVISSLSGLALQIGEAEAIGNDELKRILECAKENTMASAQSLQDGLGPVMNILELVGPLLGIAGIQVAVPAIVPGADIEGLRNTVQSLKDVVTTLEEIVEAVPA